GCADPAPRRRSSAGSAETSPTPPTRAAPTRPAPPRPRRSPPASQVLLVGVHDRSRAPPAADPRVDLRGDRVAPLVAAVAQDAPVAAPGGAVPGAAAVVRQG